MSTQLNEPAASRRPASCVELRGVGNVVSAWQHTPRSAIALITPSGVLAEVHSRMAEPGSGKRA